MKNWGILGGFQIQIFLFSPHLNLQGIFYVHTHSQIYKWVNIVVDLLYIVPIAYTS